MLTITDQPGVGQSGRSAPRPSNRRGRWILGLVLSAVPVSLSACSGGSSPTVASLGSTTTTAATAAPAGTASGPGRAQPEKFAQCMRSHGVSNFPDPIVNGNSIEIRINPSISGNPKFASAMQACKYLMPGLSKKRGPSVTPQQQDDYLKASACMRSHGITNFPDFTFSGGDVKLNIPSTMNINSPQFNQARQVCQKLIPSGLPYSGTT